VPGPGTAGSLRAEGVPAAAIVAPAEDAAQLDSQSLWRELERRDWRGARVLVVRGDGGRDWLIERFAEAGAAVDTVAAYRRLAPRLSVAARRDLDAALAAPAAHAWLFSSSRRSAISSARRRRVRPGARALATHPRIAARARQRRLPEVIEVQPGLDAVVACIQSMQP
jgi:uroporphyrinogen-III synthase